jgi:hypothetical protein
MLGWIAPPGPPPITTRSCWPRENVYVAAPRAQTLLREVHDAAVGARVPARPAKCSCTCRGFQQGQDERGNTSTICGSMAAWGKRGRVMCGVATGGLPTPQRGHCTGKPDVVWHFSERQHHRVCGNWWQGVRWVGASWGERPTRWRWPARWRSGARAWEPVLESIMMACKVSHNTQCAAPIQVHLRSPPDSCS